MAKLEISIKSEILELIDVINSNDALAVLTSLQTCIDKIRANLPHLDFECNVLDDIEIQVQDLIEDAEYDDNDMSDIDYIVRDFYNFCDRNGVYII